MRLERILHRLNCEPWAILPSQHEAIRQLLDSHLAGAPLPSFSPTPEDDNATPYTVVGNTAVLDVAGVLLNKCSGLESLCGAFSLESFRSNLRAAAALPNVENIILNISSPGGSVTGIAETANLIAEVAQSKDVYAYSNDLIASAAYWLASQATAIFTSQSAQVGSIGVINYQVDSSAAFAQQGLKAEVFTTGQYKAMGAPGTAFTDAQKALLQSNVDKLYAQFVSTINASRNVNPDALQGQTFYSADALDSGLIDGVIDELDELISTLNSKNI